ncbi:MAG: archease [Nitrospirota bacterium]
MNFRVLDLSGDVGLEAFGASREEAFGNAALGMYALITDLSAITERQDLEVRAEGDSPEGLLVNYLNELIFHFDTYGFIGKRVDIAELSDTAIRATVHGEEFDADRHERRLLIKAATYHRIKVAESDGRWEVAVIFDI